LISLSAEEISFFSTLKSNQRQLQWLSYRCALKEINEGIHLPVSYNLIGKPIIENVDFYISVAHSGNYSIAIKSHKRCGVDIEKNSNKAHTVRNKFMSNSEINFADNHNPELISLFTWCAKEAMYKAMGLEGVIFANDMAVLDFDFDNLTAKGLFSFDSNNAEFELLFYQHPDFVSVICWEI
jgi:phosphopantetheinyl transferase